MNELNKNGYEVLVGKRLNDFKLVVQHQLDPEMDFGIKNFKDESFSKHIKNVFDDGELDKESNMQKMHIANY